ncbi:allatostatin-A receptor-like isoform X2 [Schistocerca gregaria]|uniref:allatostatin-A receptor-like isoform X2 n=1 Tax=Schistocerca gregaria TaxID=7010 RepID=UPI00211E7229|nr:allatostatin-A receptor-like isoform X2 [Schistocerca gregaria]
MYEKCANYTAGGPVSLVEAALLETLCRNVSSSAAEAAEAEAAAEAAAGDWAASSVLQRAVAVVVPLLFGLIVLLGLVGNALVVLVVAANQQMRSTTNLLIINLASADLLFIVFCVPSTATDYLLPFWPFGDAWCKVVQYLIVVTCYASVYTLVLMSFDRYLAVVHPVSSMGLRTQRHALSAIAVTWVVILAACAPVYTSHGVVGYDFEKIHHTACVFLEATHNKPAFQVNTYVPV